MLNDRVKKFFDNFIPLLGRVSIGAVFWQSGQTKIQGFVVDFVGGKFSFGWPQLSDSVVDLFREEYRLPLIPPHEAAILAALAEHALPLLLVLGLATRLSALGLLGMTMVIQIFVYPDAWPVHGTWATILLILMLKGGGQWTLDALIAPHMGRFQRLFA